MQKGLAIRLALWLIAAMLVTAAPAGAAMPIQPWDGQNPFNCELQQLGLGVDYPDPGADPLCVEFDKTQQNIAPDLGLVDFLANEPARVAAAVPKCFYFQRDHWTGSVTQGEDPELWNWDGSYFFDKARGLGGVHVKDFRIGGVPFDATPYAPAQFQPYLEESGGGGVWLAGEIDAQPDCVAMVDTPREAARIYRSAPAERNCVDAGGNVVRRGIGKLRLGLRRDELDRRFGTPGKRGRRADRWCSVGGGAIGAAYAGPNGVSARVRLVVTNSRGHTISGIGPRSRAREARKRRLGETTVRVAGARVIRVKHRGAPAFAGLDGGRIRWLAIGRARLARDRATLRRSLHDYLRDVR